MICLVGEQPIPNLLPIRHYNPSRVVLVESGSQATSRTSKNLKQLLKPKIEVDICQVSPYGIVVAQECLEAFLSQNSFLRNYILFNLTGGTKPMSLAAFRLAEQLKAPFVYLKSEGGQSLLYRYKWESNALELEDQTPIEEAITMEDYLIAHVGHIERKPKFNQFEQVVFTALKPHVSEIMQGVWIDQNIELDLTIRCGNQIGVAEVTEGRPNKKKD